jgi:hypothetical protein
MLSGCPPARLSARSAFCPPPPVTCRSPLILPRAHFASVVVSLLPKVSNAHDFLGMKCRAGKGNQQRLQWACLNYASAVQFQLSTNKQHTLSRNALQRTKFCARQLGVNSDRFLKMTWVKLHSSISYSIPGDSDCYYLPSLASPGGASLQGGKVATFE